MTVSSDLLCGMLLGAHKALIHDELREDVVVEIGDDGRIVAVGTRAELGSPDRILKGTLLPGLVDAHSSVVGYLFGLAPFARHRPSVVQKQHCDRVAMRLDPDILHAVARHAFVQMIEAGIATVGELHTIHHRPDGSPYDIPTALVDAVLLAAREVGIRLCLLRGVSLRGDRGGRLTALERRCCEPGVDTVCERFGFTLHRINAYRDPRLSAGLAIPEMASVPLEAVVAFKTRLAHLPLHMGASEYLEDVPTRVALYGAGPVEFLVRAGVVDGCTTLVGVQNLRAGESELVGQVGGTVCSCPPAFDQPVGTVREIEAAGARVCVGSNGRGSSSVLESARMLGRQLSPSHDLSWLARATAIGAQALGLRTGRIAPGHWADLVSIDLDEVEAAELLASDEPLRVCDVIVGGKLVMEDGEHPLATRAASVFEGVRRTLLPTSW
ncbi:amidohydrolase family protein [Myxococcota bacterium]